MSNLIDREFIKRLGGECIARRDRETGELIAITGIDLLPSAQPDVPDTNVGDMIYRQAAIDTLADMHCKSDEDGYIWIIRSDAWARIDALPSVQPEIIRCRDCKHYDPYDSRKAFCCLEGIDGCYPDDFCSYAERRTDE